MSPELLAPDKSGLKSSRPTKRSDCYALGMVIYEVLTGKVPFASFSRYMVIRKVVGGERPERPKGAEGAWFTDSLWRTVNRCWATQPGSRPSIVGVLEHLERALRDPEPPSPQVDEDSKMGEGDWNLTSNSSGDFSWFNPRYFVPRLRRIVCLRAHLKNSPEEA